MWICAFVSIFSSNSVFILLYFYNIESCMRFLCRIYIHKQIVLGCTLCRLARYDWNTLSSPFCISRSPKGCSLPSKHCTLHHVRLCDLSRALSRVSKQEPCCWKSTVGDRQLRPGRRLSLYLPAQRAKTGFLLCWWRKQKIKEQYSVQTHFLCFKHLFICRDKHTHTAFPLDVSCRTHGP